jgi:hypothetical protein
LELAAIQVAKRPLTARPIGSTIALERCQVIQTKFPLAVALGCVLAGPSFAQYVISAHSGLIHYTEGDVFIGDAAIKQKFGEYPDVKAGQHLRTTEGRAEVLLTPGVFLRLAENSEIAMLSTALTNTRIEVVAGSVILEASEVQKDQAIELTVGGSVVDVRKRGVFRIDAGTPPRVRVFDGEVTVAEAGRPLTVKEGKQLVFTSVPMVEKFAKDDTDSFYRWAGRRSGYLAVANVSAARQMYENSIPWRMGGWYYSPYFGMFTYVPLQGRFTNAWNHSYYAPTQMQRPEPINPNYGGYSGMSASRGYSGNSGQVYSGSGGYQAPATASAAAPAPAAPARSADGGGGSREGGGGRR